MRQWLSEGMGYQEGISEKTKAGLKGKAVVIIT